MQSSEKSGEQGAGSFSLWGGDKTNFTHERPVPGTGGGGFWKKNTIWGEKRTRRNWWQRRPETPSKGRWGLGGEMSEQNLGGGWGTISTRPNKGLHDAKHREKKQLTRNTTKL